MRKTCLHKGYIIMVQQYMAGLRGIIISNDVISEVPSVAIIGIITYSGTCKRTCSIHPRNLRHISKPEIALDLVQGPVPNHLRGHIPNYRLV